MIGASSSDFLHPLLQGNEPQAPMSVSMPLPLLRAAIDEAQNNIQAPRALVVFGAMTALSVAAQALIDVRKPNGQCVPTSLMLLSIANSGERKTTSENVFLEPIRNFQNDQRRVYEGRYKAWEVSQSIWDIKRKNIIKAVKKKVAKGECSAKEEVELLDLNNAAPIRPKKFKILYDDSSSEALFRGMYEGLSTAGLVSSEGSGVLNGRAFNDLSKQNAIWSGDSIAVDRVSKDSYELPGARLTVSMMLQDSAFKKYMDQHGEKSRGSGLWARFIVCRPESTQGTRFIRNGTMSWEYRDKFSARLVELLNENVQLASDSGKEKKIIGFSPAASDRWLQLFNQIEAENREGGCFAGAGDHASKLAENVARVAALFQYFEFGGGEISLDVLNEAIQMCQKCSNDFLNIFMPPPQEQTDAFELNCWLDRYRGFNSRFIRKNTVLQCGPNKVREKRRLARALEVLSAQGLVSVFPSGKITYVDLFPMRGSGVIY